METDSLRSLLTRFAGYLAHPLAFFVVAAYGVVWFVTDPEQPSWHAVAIMATWLMTLFLNRAAHRDTQAIHAKLDELLKAQIDARSELAHIDTSEPEDIVQHREDARAALTQAQDVSAPVKPRGAAPKR